MTGYLIFHVSGAFLFKTVFSGPSIDVKLFRDSATIRILFTRGSPKVRERGVAVSYTRAFYWFRISDPDPFFPILRRFKRVLADNSDNFWQKATVRHPGGSEGKCLHPDPRERCEFSVSAILDLFNLCTDTDSGLSCLVLMSIFGLPSFPIARRTGSYSLTRCGWLDQRFTSFGCLDGQEIENSKDQLTGGYRTGTRLGSVRNRLNSTRLRNTVCYSCYYL